MNIWTRIAVVCYLVNIIYMFVVGLAFVLSDEFFSFHSDVILTAWQDVDPSSQILYLGMMRTEGAGFLATSVAMAILLSIPFRQKQLWSYLALTVIGLVEHTPTLIATYQVSRITSASPPWPVTLGMMILLAIGLGAAIKGKRQS